MLIYLIFLFTLLGAFCLLPYELDSYELSSVEDGGLFIVAVCCCCLLQPGSVLTATTDEELALPAFNIKFRSQFMRS